MRQFNKINQGFTLMELMVAMGLLAMITTVMIALFGSTKQTLVHGANKLQIQQMARLTMSRMVPYLQTAVPINDDTPAVLQVGGEKSEVGGPIWTDASATAGKGPSIGFSTTHDFIASPQPAYVPRAPIYYFYEVAFETAPRRQVILRKMNATPPGALDAPFPLSPTAPADANLRILTHGEKQAEAAVLAEAGVILKSLEFDYERRGGIRVSIQTEGPVRTAENQIRKVTYDLDTRIQFPYYANR